MKKLQNTDEKNPSVILFVFVDFLVVNIDRVFLCYHYLFLPKTTNKKFSSYFLSVNRNEISFMQRLCYFSLNFLTMYNLTFTRHQARRNLPLYI